MHLRYADCGMCRLLTSVQYTAAIARPKSVFCFPAQKNYLQNTVLIYSHLQYTSIDKEKWQYTADITSVNDKEDVRSSMINMSRLSVINFLIKNGTKT